MKTPLQQAFAEQTSSPKPYTEQHAIAIRIPVTTATPLLTSANTTSTPVSRRSQRLLLQ